MKLVIYEYDIITFNHAWTEGFGYCENHLPFMDEPCERTFKFSDIEFSLMFLLKPTFSLAQVQLLNSHNH